MIGFWFRFVLFWVFFPLFCFLVFYASKPVRDPFLLPLAADSEPHLGFKAGGNPQNKTLYLAVLFYIS